MLKILAALWGLITDWASGVLQWLRQPGAWLKASAFTLMVVFGLSAFVAYDQHVKLEEQRRQYVACKADVQGLELERETWESRIKEINGEMVAAEIERKRQLEEARRVGLQLEADLEQTRRDAQVFEARYQQRPLECSAALELLNTTCKSLEGY